MSNASLVLTCCLLVLPGLSAAAGAEQKKKDIKGFALKMTVDDLRTKIPTQYHCGQTSPAFMICESRDKAETIRLYIDVKGVPNRVQSIAYSYCTNLKFANEARRVVKEYGGQLVNGDDPMSFEIDDTTGALMYSKRGSCTTAGVAAASVITLQLSDLTGVKAAPPP